MGAEENGKAILAGNIGDMDGSEGWEWIPDLCATAGDIQAKSTRVSGGFDFLVITGQTIVGPSDYILRLVFLIFIRKPFEVFS